MKDIILDRLAVSALSQITDAIMEHIAGDAFDVTEVEKRWHDVMQYMRGKVSAETFLHNLYKKYIPSVKVTIFSYLYFTSDFSEGFLSSQKY